MNENIFNNKANKKEAPTGYAVFLNKIIAARKMNPGAKNICQKCFTPIFEMGGKCPNCEN